MLDPHPAFCRQDTDASIMEGEYEWVREYLYDVRQDEEKRTYVLRETPDYMGYVDLNTRLMVHKRGKRLKSEQLQPQEFPRPAKVSCLAKSAQFLMLSSFASHVFECWHSWCHAVQHSL